MPDASVLTAGIQMPLHVQESRVECSPDQVPVVAAAQLQSYPNALANSLLSFEIENHSRGSLQSKRVLLHLPAALFAPASCIVRIAEQKKDRHDITCSPPLVFSPTRGLACIHKAGIAHRDMKPDNLLLSADGCLKVRAKTVVKKAYASQKMSFQRKCVTRREA
eukprot:1161040-Pelagomonas_calceolata.AAC.7